MIKTRSQIYAEAAIKVVSEWASNKENAENENATNGNAVNENATNENAESENGEEGDPKQNLRSTAISFPAQIQTCGLLQALAFVEKKNETYAKGFKTVLNERLNSNPLGNVASIAKVDSLFDLNAVDYMILSRMAIEAATWIKRYAAIVLPDPNADQ